MYTDGILRHRTDTLANWEKFNPVLAKGEIVIVNDGDTVKLKAGDGAKKFTSLPYIGGAIADLSGINNNINNILSRLSVLENARKIISITKTLTLTTDWQDTGIKGSALSTGVYIVSVTGFSAKATLIWSENFVGLMSWYENNTNDSNFNEIALHPAGHAINGIMISLRTLRMPNIGFGGVEGDNFLKLEIKSNINLNESPVTFNFMKLF